MTGEVSANQERYLLAERFTPSTYQMPFSFRVVGPLDVSRLRRAVDGTIARHAILRTEFFASEAGFTAWPDKRPATLEEIDLPCGDPAQARELILRTVFAKPATLNSLSLVKALIIRLAPHDHVLALSLHHALSDAISMQLFIREIADRYNGGPVSTPLHDFAELITNDSAGSAPSDSKAFWQSRLGGLDDIPELPRDLDCPVDIQNQSPISLRLDWSAMQRLSESHRVTPFTIAAAMSHIVLARYCATRQMVLTFQSSGRKPYPGSATTIGPFSNSLVLVGDVRPDLRVADVIRDQATAIAEAIANESYPYHMVVHDTRVQPKFGINWYPRTTRMRLSGLDVSPADPVHRLTNYDVDFRFVRDDEGLELVVWFDAGQFSRERIQQIALDMRAALDRLDEVGDCTVEDLFATPPPLVVPPPTEIPKERLFDAFLRQAARTPERIALLGDGWQMTYAEVEAASSALARRLVVAGLGVTSRIVIVADRGPQLVWTNLAVLRIGATMVPLDASYPDERLATLIAVALPDAILLPEAGPTPQWAGGAAQIIAVRDPNAGEVPLDAVPAASLAAGDPDEPAYILFTSGSTGTPKGIATSHRPALNFLKWQRETFAITADDRFTNLNGVAHDMMIRDIFQPLSIGAQLAIPPQSEIYRPGRLLEWLNKVSPTVTHLTPAMGQLLCMAMEPGQHLGLRAAFFGGDRLLPELTEKMRELAPGATIVNFYGATETPQAAAYHIVDPDAHWRTHPIGRGIDNMRLRIVDSDRQPAPDGAPGEIAVLTPFLSLGYVSKGTVVPHPQPGIYFTGDMGFVLPSGAIMFTGRQDDQVNIRGYRIELEEINRALADLPGVKEAHVLVDNDGSRLVAFVVGEKLDEDRLYGALTRKLPNYMVPGDIVVLDHIPLLPNGKLDRRGLLAIQRQPRALKEGRSAETATERALVETWTRYIGISGITVEHSFAELRGDSLTYVQVMLATEALVGPLPDDWQMMPIVEIAKQDTPKLGLFKWIDSALVTRAVAIVLVAALHLGVFSIGGGSTSALFLVSGYFVGRIQVREMFRIRSSAPLWRTFGRIFLLSAVYAFLFFGIKRSLDMPASIAIPLFYEDFIDMRDLAVVQAEGHAIFLWYIACLLHMIAIVAILTELVLRFGKGKVDPRIFIICLFALGLILRFIFPVLIDPNFHRNGIEILSALAHMPTTHLATYVLGAGIGLATTSRERLLYTALIVIYCALTATIVETSGYLMIAVFGLLMLYVPQLPIPKGLHFIMLLLSGSSLFIYLTHGQVGNALAAAGVARGSMLQLGGALAFGILLWFIWQKFVVSALYSERGRRNAAVTDQ